MVKQSFSNSARERQGKTKNEQKDRKAYVLSEAVKNEQAQNSNKRYYNTQ